jgi:hypothetical protein
MTLRVRTDELVEHAGELYGDACAFHGLHYYLQRVGEIPYEAWGRMSWSDKWRSAWEQAVANRVTESDTIRDQACEACGRVLEAAADYADADVCAAALIGSTNPDTTPYVNAYAQRSPVLTAHPGGAPPAPVLPEPIPLAALQYPQDSQRWQSLRGERLPDLMYGLTSDIYSKTLSTVSFSTVENDGLDEFVKEHYATLNGADAVVDEYALGSKRPFADVILPARKATPSIIGNRAQMIGSAGNTYQQIRATFVNAVNRLTLGWQGDGAEAYLAYAKSFGTYLDQIGGQVTWLGSEGTKVAKLIRDLRNQYAQLGAKHIKRIADLYQKYIDTVTSTFGRITECTSPASAGKALLGAVQSMTQEMTAQEDAAMDQAIDLLNIESRAIGGSPDLDLTDPTHDAVPFPTNLLDDGRWYTGWTYKH